MNKITNVAQPLIFEPITLGHKERVESIRKKYGNTIYVYTFPSLFAWKDDEEYEICIHDEAFVVKNGAEGENAYLFPCGSDRGKKEILDALLKYEKPELYSLTDADRAFLEKEYPDTFVFIERRDEFIYLFDKDEQLELNGKDFKKQRHQIHIGETSAQNWSTEPLNKDNIYRATALNKKWSEGKGSYTLADTKAAQCALENFDELSMRGLLFTADGEDAAYVAGSFITPEIFDLSFCKVLGDRRDFFVRWAFFRSLPEEVKTIDSEEDLGIEGLRINKLTRHPKELTRIWKGVLNNE